MENKNEVIIETINIKINDNLITLTPDEAKKLQNTLNKFFGKTQNEPITRGFYGITPCAKSRLK